MSNGWKNYRKMKIVDRDGDTVETSYQWVHKDGVKYMRKQGWTVVRKPSKKEK